MLRCWPCVTAYLLSITQYSMAGEQGAVSWNGTGFREFLILCGWHINLQSILPHNTFIQMSPRQAAWSQAIMTTSKMSKRNCNKNISICYKARSFIHRTFPFFSISFPVQLILTQLKAHLEMVLNLIPLSDFINLWSWPGLQGIKRQTKMGLYKLELGKHLLEHPDSDKTFPSNTRGLKIEMVSPLKCLKEF